LRIAAGQGLELSQGNLLSPTRPATDSEVSQPPYALGDAMPFHQSVGPADANQCLCGFLGIGPKNSFRILTPFMSL